MQESLSEQGILLIQLLGKDDDWVNNFSEKFIGFNRKSLNNCLMRTLILFISMNLKAINR